MANDSNVNVRWIVLVLAAALGLMVASGAAQQKNRGDEQTPGTGKGGMDFDEPTESMVPPGIEDLPPIDWGPDSDATVEETLERFRREGRRMENDSIYVVPDGIPPLGMDPDDPPRAERPAALRIPYIIKIGVSVTEEYWNLYGGNWTSLHSRVNEMVRYANQVLVDNGISAWLWYAWGYRPWAEHPHWTNIEGIVTSGRWSKAAVLEYFANTNYYKNNRDNHSLDLQVTIGAEIASDACGWAYVPAWPVPGGAGRVPGESEWLPFHHYIVQDGRWNDAVCPRSYANITFAHEFGHVAGLQHDRVTHQVQENERYRKGKPLLGWPGPSYAYGWQQCGIARTVMSYGDSCGILWPSYYGNTDTPFVNLFSSPWKTAPSGHVLGSNGTIETFNVSGPAYGARRIQEMIPFIAGYR